MAGEIKPQQNTNSAESIFRDFEIQNPVKYPVPNLDSGIRRSEISYQISTLLNFYPNLSAGQNKAAYNFTPESGGIYKAEAQLNTDLQNPGLNASVKAKLGQAQNTEIYLRADPQKNTIGFNQTAGNFNFRASHTIRNNSEGYVRSKLNPNTSSLGRGRVESNDASKNYSTTSVSAEYYDPNLRTTAGYKYTGDQTKPIDSRFFLSSRLAEGHIPLKDGSQNYFELNARINAGQLNGQPYTETGMTFSYNNISEQPNGQKRERSLIELNASFVSIQEELTRRGRRKKDLVTRYSAPVNTFTAEAAISVTPSTNIRAGYGNTVHAGKSSSNISNFNFALDQRLSPSSSLNASYNENTSSFGNTRTYSLGYRNAPPGYENNPFMFNASQTADPRETSYSAEASVPLDGRSSASIRYERAPDNTQLYTASYRRQFAPNFFLDASGTSSTDAEGKQTGSWFLGITGSAHF